MNRSTFLRNTAGWACASCAALVLGRTRLAAADDLSPVEQALKQAKYENTFINHWLTDLVDAMDTELDPTTRMKLIESCGRACFRRHRFKTDIAQKGKGDLAKLIEAYRSNFIIARESDRVHIRYGGGRCYCPAARNRPTRPNDLHCECTRATHQAIFETALGRPFKIELVETVRRGGQECHLVVHLT